MISLLVDLDRFAAETPQAPALSTLGRSYSFAELREAVDAVAIRLRQEGVKPRDVVGVDLPSALEWIVDLALLRLATRSVSVRGTAPGAIALDVAIGQPGHPTAMAPIALQLDELWVAGAVSRAEGPAPAVDYARPDSTFRLMLTSGTTGTPRAAAYSVGALETRRAGLDAYWTDERAELNFMPLSTTGGLHTAVAALNHGEAFRAVDAVDAATLRFAAAEGIRVLCGSPMQIAHALEIIAAEGIEIPTLEEVRMAGAAPSSALLRNIASTLRVPVRGVYGSTEGGGVTMRLLDATDNPADVGPALPGFELQIVDEGGAVVAPGIEGLIRYRGPAMTSGYFERGEVVPFPRGWFQPGDLGSLAPDGSLVLGGRTSEIINIGGMKIDPARVDELAMEFAGVRDAAAFGLERASGLAELGLAVVAEPECDLRQLDRVLRAKLPGAHPTTYWRVAEIPRNRMGKVERSLLTQAHARARG